VILNYYAGTVASLHVEDGKYQEVILDRGDQTTRLVWSRLGDTVLIAVPALASSATLVDQTGQETTIQPLAGTYVLILNPATCPEGFGCFIGGPPVLIVEDATADLSAGGTLTRNFAITATTLSRGAVGGSIVIGLAIIGYVVIKRRRNRN